MNQNDIKKLTGLGLFFAHNQDFQKLRSHSQFNSFILQNEGLIFSIISEAFQVSIAGEASTLVTPNLGKDALLKSPFTEGSIYPENIVAVSKIAPPEQNPPVVKGLPLDFIEKDVVKVICAKTGYPTDMVEYEMDLEADLGIDTVKKMEIMADLADKYQLQFRKDFNISQLSTVKSIAQLINSDASRTAALDAK